MNTYISKGFGTRKIGEEHASGVYEIEEGMDALENLLQGNNKLHAHRFIMGGKLRVIRVEDYKKGLLNTVEARSFERGLLDLFAELKRKPVTSKDNKKGGNATPASEIDGFILNNGMLRAEAIGGSYILSASKHKDKNILEVDSKKLIYAFELFNEKCGELNALEQNGLFWTMRPNFLQSSDYSTARFTIKDNNPQDYSTERR